MPVTKLSVFSRRDFSPPKFLVFLHLDQLNVRLGWQVFFVLQRVIFFSFGTYLKKKKAIKMFYSLADKGYIHVIPFSP